MGMNVAPIATSSPCRVVTVVGVDRSRTFSLSNVILQKGTRRRGERKRDRQRIKRQAVHAFEVCKPATICRFFEQKTNFQTPPRASPEHMHVVCAQSDVSGGQIHRLRDQPLLQGVPHAARKQRSR